MNSDKKIPEEVKKILEKNGIKVLKYIDCGSTAQVFKAHMKDKDVDRDVAVKFIDLNKQSVNVKEKYIPRELSIVKTVSHQNIIKSYKVFEWEKKFVFIITDFADGGDLIGVLEKGQALGETKAKLWFSEIASAVEYLHSRGIAHRDLKADNILIHNNHMKLTDFGYARVSVLPNGTVKKCQTLCGTLEYQSPEAIDHSKPYDPLVSDCFSLGVLLFTMITNMFPFGTGAELRTDCGRRQLIHAIKQQDWSLPKHLKDNDNLFSLLKQLLNPDPYSRIRSSQIRSHPWFKK